MKTHRKIVLFSALMLSVAFSEPWYTNHRLDWKPFTALSTINNPNGLSWRWEIQERANNGTPKFFAQSIIWNNPQTIPLSDNKFLVADSSTVPVFSEVSASLPFVNAYSMATVRWNKTYDELFIGTSSGLWRFDEDLGQLVNVWSWTWDPVYQIVSLGTSIFGRVTSWGSQSGYHLWKPDGTDTYTPFGGTSNIWGDSITGAGGINNYICKPISASQSLILAHNSYGSDKYSLNGGLSFITPLGTRTDAADIYAYDFYPCNGSTIIVRTWDPSGYNKIYIGTLSGNFYPLSLPQVNTISVFFYSPSTRLLIAGDAYANTIYSAILPAPDEEVLPKPTVNVGANDVTVSWPTQHPPVRVQISATLATDSWQDVSITQVVVGDKIQIVIPKTGTEMFYRLAMP